MTERSPEDEAWNIRYSDINPILQSLRKVDWEEEKALWFGNWAERDLTLAEEFEELRKAGPKWSSAQQRHMQHIEEHLDKGDLICRCYRGDNGIPTSPDRKAES